MSHDNVCVMVQYGKEAVRSVDAFVGEHAQFIHPLTFVDVTYAVVDG